MFILHHCDNPACVRPDHLFIGSAAENMKDKIQKGRGYSPPSNCSLSKLSWKDVRSIRALYLTGRYRKMQLAERYHIHYGTLRKILTYQSWKNDPMGV
jgi:hypothetical protein